MPLTLAAWHDRCRTLCDAIPPIAKEACMAADNEDIDGADGEEGAPQPKSKKGLIIGLVALLVLETEGKLDLTFSQVKLGTVADKVHACN